MTTSKLQDKLLRHARFVYEQARKKWGQGYSLLGENLKKAVLAQELLYLLAGRDEETQISPSQITEYLEAVYSYAELKDKP